jgi:hypothetical protein
MLTRFAVLIGLVTVGLAVFAASASAVTLVTEGASATRTGDRVDLAFTPAALAAAKLKAGAKVDISCELVPLASSLAFFVTDEEAEDGTVYGQGTIGADGTTRIPLFGSEGSAPGVPRPVVDKCEVERLDRLSANSTFSTPITQVALTPAGVVWVDEYLRGLRLHELLVRAHGAQGYAPAAPGAVALPAPGTAPPAGQIGYWTNGTRATVVAVSAAGRRLVAEDLGHGMLRTNVFEQLDPVGAVSTDVFRELLEPDGGFAEKLSDKDRGPSPQIPGGPLDPSDGVRTSRDGRRLIVRFTGRSAKTIRLLAGRRISVLCLRRPAPTLFPSRGIAKDDVGGSGRTRVPTRGGRVVFGLSAAKGDLCLVVDDGALIAYAARGAAGRRWFYDFDALVRIVGADTSHLAAPGAKAYRTTADAVRRSDGLVALAGPNGPAPVGQIGVWTDGGQRSVVATRSGSGRTYLLADDGQGVVRTNVFGGLSGLLLQLLMNAS